MVSGSKRAVYAAFIGNGTIAVIKFLVALVSRSSAMMAEAFHSMADMGNQALLLLGIKRSHKPADSEHPFGYGKEQYFWSFVVANMIFLIGAVASFYEGLKKLSHPHPIERSYLIYTILSLSFVIETISLTVALKEFLKHGRSKNILKELQESKNPNLMVVIVEDTAAVISLMIAATGVIFTEITDIETFDAAASIIIGCILAFISFFLANEMRKLLIGESASKRHLDTIRRVVLSFQEVKQIGKIYSMHMGPEDILLAIDLDFVGNIQADRLEIIVDKIEAHIKKEVPEVKQIFIEADGESVKFNSSKAFGD